MSFLRRIWSRITRPTHLVGTDLEGNRFYEHPGTTNDPRRTKRVVEYSKGRDMLHYIAGERRLPVQWTSWLTHTRLHPPTLEELQADLERQRRVLFDAALIEAREREERARQQIHSPQDNLTAVGGATRLTETTPERKAVESPGLPREQETLAQGPPIAPQQDLSRRASAESSWHRPPGAVDEPQPWSPKSVRRGGE